MMKDLKFKENKIQNLLLLYIKKLDLIKNHLKSYTMEINTIENIMTLI
jgi:hypothetical protein